MPAPTATFRFSGATGLHRGDRAYQQDQVDIIAHHRTPGCVLGLVADGMGGKSGGRKAADQVQLTGRQIFERFVPNEDDAGELLRQLVQEAHLMMSHTAPWQPSCSAPTCNATWCMPVIHVSITSVALRWCAARSTILSCSG